LYQYDQDELKASDHEQRNANQNNQKRQELDNEVLEYRHPMLEHERFYLDIHDEHMREQEKRNDDVMMLNLNNIMSFYI
jgi:hypothetical protein